MGAAEFAEWQALASIEPLGAARDDLHTAMLMTLQANANRNAKKRREPFTIANFLPDFWRQPDAPVEPKSLAAKFRSLTENYGNHDA